MAGRGAQTFKKRQKEQQRKEKQQEKISKRLERKRLGLPDEPDEELMSTAEMMAAELAEERSPQPS